MDLRLVPAALTAWAATAAGIAWGWGPAIAAVCAGAGAAWSLAARLFGDRRPVLRAAGIGVAGVAVIGCAFGLTAGLRSDAVRHHPVTQRFGSAAWVTVIPGEGPHMVAAGRLMFRGDLARVGDDELSGAVTVFAAGPDFGRLIPGQPVRFRARLAKPARRDLSIAVLTAVGRPEFGATPAVQRVAQAVRVGFAAACRAVLPADQAAMLPGLVLGDTSAVAAATTSEFRIAGLTHLTAVSGANVSIVCAAVLLSARFIGPRPAVGLAALALVAFVVVVQPGASVLRAAVMGAIGLLAVLSARRRQAIPVLSATVIALMVTAPQLAVDVGFALSVSATAALVVLAPIWSRRLVARGWPKPVADGLCIALAAQWATAPLIAAISGRLSVVSVIANLAVGVVIPPITLFGTAAAALAPLWPAGAGLLIRFTGPEVWWLLHAAHLAAAVPGAAIAVPSGWAGLGTVGCAGVASVLLWRWRWFRRTCAGAVLVALAWSVSALVGAS
ncbi:MAG: ComEC/Rec2 family competence protein [Mycobacterium sp.]